ncbi:MAG TPA: hypothetical protein VHG91_11025, partial [Longimicrobium sp.]|nr:hypothetical protein [Longimicrobium sp.]
RVAQTAWNRFAPAQWAVAAALGPAPCHIVTDVAAVFDRDPRRDAAARPLSALTHAELVRLTEGGAKVVHPEAARLALRHRVPLSVYHFRASLSGAGGTRIGRTETIDLSALRALPGRAEVAA